MWSGVLRRPIVRWFAYAVSFGLLWGALAQALLWHQSLSVSVARGAAGGIFFATVAVVREHGGARRRRRPEPPAS
jgi:uncharacterized protein (DUF2062 family)